MILCATLRKLEGVDFMETKNLIELIKGAIYCTLRQKFDVDEVKEIYEKIDRAVAMSEEADGDE